MTLNMLRASRHQPKLSAYTALEGQFDFNATPLAPPGTKAIIHVPNAVRKTFGYNGTEAWYIGPTMEMYRHYKFYLPTTRAVHESDRVKWLPYKTPIPTLNTSDYLRQAAADIHAILQQQPIQHSINQEYGNDTINAWSKIAKLLQQAASTTDDTTTTTLPKAPRAQRVLSQNNTENSTNPYAKTYTRNYKAMAIAKITQDHQAQQAQAIFMLNNDGKKLSYDKLITGPNKELWTKSSANEFGRLLNGFGKNTRAPHKCIRGTKTMEPIHKHDVPSNKTVTYGNFQCTHRPQKINEPFCTRLTVGGDKLDFDDDIKAPATQMTEAKILFNSVISDHKQKGSQFCTVDIKDFYLNNPLPHAQYMKIPKHRIPDKGWQEYELDNYLNADNHIYFKITKGMYGLKEAGIVAWKHLVEHLKKYGYTPMKLTTGLWKHETRPTIFTLTVDDFGIKHNSEADLQHLLTALQDKYIITVDKKGETYLGITLEWHYDEGYIDISMPGYVARALDEFQYKPKNKPQDAPHKWTEVTYGKKQQNPTTEDSAPLLPADGKKRVWAQPEHLFLADVLSLPSDSGY